MGDASGILWRWHLRDLRHRRPSWFLENQGVPVFCWGILGGFKSFDAQFLALTALPLIPIAFLGWSSYFLLRRLKGRRSKGDDTMRLTVLVNSLYYGTVLAVTSAYMLGIALHVVSTLPHLGVPLRDILIGLYVVSGIASLAYSPWSMARSIEDEQKAREREGRWLPWALGCQGLLVGIGVFLGSWFLHEDISWEPILLGGLATLGALLLISVSMIGFQRFVILARSEPPKASIDGSP